MNPEELEAIKARHRRVWKPEFNCHHCAWCSEPMPCDTAVALAEVERLRGVVEAVLREHTPEAPDGRADRCRLCSPQEKRWPCSTVLEARAALEGKE